MVCCEQARQSKEKILNLESHYDQPPVVKVEVAKVVDPTGTSEASANSAKPSATHVRRSDTLHLCDALLRWWTTPSTNSA